MIGRTLSLYFAKRFTVMVLAIFMFFMLLITAITYLEFFTRSLKVDQFDATKVLLLSLFRVPSICEDVLPFTVLFGSIAAFVVANRRLEVVIARAAGVSAWQFLLPACIVGLLFGVIATTLYNPASTCFGPGRTRSAPRCSPPTPDDDSKSRSRCGSGRPPNGRESIIGALRTFDHGLSLTGVTAFVFDEKGSFHERVDAPTGALFRGRVAVRERHRHGARAPSRNA